MFKIFVGNLDYKVRADQVRELFALYAPIEDLVLPTDPKTSKPRGFAIVMIRDPELGAAAIRGVQGKRLMGRELVVNEAMKKKGKASAVPPTPARSGPFGPRMFKSADGRGRGSRNPRRASGGSLPRPAGPGLSPPPKAVPPSVPPMSSPAPSGPSRSVLPAASPTRLPSEAPPARAESPTDTPRMAVPKARPKSPPEGPTG